MNIWCQDLRIRIRLFIFYSKAVAARVLRGIVDVTLALTRSRQRQAGHVATCIAWVLLLYTNVYITFVYGYETNHYQKDPLKIRVKSNG